MVNEIRRDYLLNRWVIMSPNRARKPTDIRSQPLDEEPSTKHCFFCPGNEKTTPPSFLLYIPSKGGIKEGRDPDDGRVKNWRVRCINNLYPAVTPRKERHLTAERLHLRKDAVGAHEIIIESPKQIHLAKV